ncbi:MAG: protein kinase [bacterium]
MSSSINISDSSSSSDDSQPKTRLDLKIVPKGARLGNYRIVEEIDRGGMAVVYKSVQEGLDREVALKVLPANITINRKFVERFNTEAKSIAALSHENIVRIYEVVNEKDLYFIVMEYIPGLNLYKFLVQKKPNTYTVLQIICALANALEYAHSKNIIHRDLKLNNVIMKNNEKPVLIDFGLAKAHQAEGMELTVSGEIVGSPAYMSPEQASGEHVDERSDVYSLAIMLYELLTGKNPYLDKRGYQQTILNVLESDPRPPRQLNQWIPKDIETIVLKALQKDVNNRYQTARALRLDLERYQNGESILAKPMGIYGRIRRLFRKHTTLAVSVCIIILMGAGFYFYYYKQLQKEIAFWEEVRPFTKLSAENWEIFSEESRELQDWLDKSTVWKIINNRFVLEHGHRSYVRYKHVISGDIKVYFILKPLDSDVSHLDLFIGGNTPDNGYTFRFNPNGITLTRIMRDNTVAASKPFLFKKGIAYSLTLEKLDENIKLLINNKKVIEYSDYIPISGAGDNTFGFSSMHSGVEFSNFAIQKMSTPFLIKPIKLGDSHFKRGQFKAALEEYLNVGGMYQNTSLAELAFYKAGICQMKLKQYKAASHTFLELQSEIAGKRLWFEAGVQLIMCYMEEGDNIKAVEILKRMKNRDQNNPAYIKLVAYYCSKIRLWMDINTPESRLFIHEGFNNLLGYLNAFKDNYIQTHLDYTQWLIKNDNFSKAEEVLEQIQKKYEDSDNAMAKVYLARAELFAVKGYFNKAVELYNRVIAEKSNYRDAYSNAWLKIGDIYRATYRFNDAIKSYKFIETSDYPNRLLKTQALNRLGLVYGEMDSLNSSRYYFRQVLEKYPDMGAETHIAQFFLGKISKIVLKREFFTDEGVDPVYYYYLGEKQRQSGDCEYTVNLKKFLYFVKYDKVYSNIAAKQLKLGLPETGSEKIKKEKKTVIDQPLPDSKEKPLPGKKAMEQADKNKSTVDSMKINVQHGAVINQDSLGVAEEENIKRKQDSLSKTAEGKPALEPDAAVLRNNREAEFENEDAKFNSTADKGDSIIKAPAEGDKD